MCAVILLVRRPEDVPDVPFCTPDPLVSFRLCKAILCLSLISPFETAKTATTTTTTTTTSTFKDQSARNRGPMITMIKRTTISNEGESNTKREKDVCLNLPRRSLLLSLTNLNALLSGLEWKWISKIVIGDVGERASERASKE